MTLENYSTSPYTYYLVWNCPTLINNQSLSFHTYTCISRYAISSSSFVKDKEETVTLFDTFPSIIFLDKQSMWMFHLFFLT